MSVIMYTDGDTLGAASAVGMVRLTLSSPKLINPFTAIGDYSYHRK